METDHIEKRQTYRVEKREVNPNAVDDAEREITLRDDAFIVDTAERAPHRLVLFVAVPVNSRSADADADSIEQCVYVKDNDERCQNAAEDGSKTCWLDSHEVQ